VLAFASPPIKKWAFAHFFVQRYNFIKSLTPTKPQTRKVRRLNRPAGAQHFERLATELLL
jgi:hypothetical protein